MYLENKEFDFKWYDGSFHEELSAFIEDNIVIREDLVGWVMYDLSDDKLFLETINDLTLAESLSEYKDSNSKLIVGENDVRLIYRNDYGDFNAIVKNIPASFEEEYSDTLDLGNDDRMFDLVKVLPKLMPRNADSEFLVNGFELVQDTAGTIKYKSNVYSEEILFNKNKKTYTAKRSGSKSSPLVINANLHKAISMKVKELEW